MREPSLSPVGSGIINSTVGEVVTPPAPPTRAELEKAADLYRDQRISKIGDIVTVNIAINDKATFGNSTDRSRTAATGLSLDFSTTNASTSSSNPATLKTDMSSTSSNKGQGNIDRAEQIQVSVAAIVTEVMPNGNLVISGSQEVRVNYELRQLSVAGIVRPWDIAQNNTVAYDRIAEARISYGGKGRLTDVQQPNWGQQLYDRFMPF
jgi:flagellar L-ring protein precursor FlgH